MPYNELAQQINKTAVDHGFWEEDRNLGEMLMLAVSEISEALEEHRDSHPALWYKHEPACPTAAMHEPLHTTIPCTKCNCKPEGHAVELADCIIRCMDTLYSYDPDNPVDISEYITHEKMFRLNSSSTLPENFGEACLSICTEISLAEQSNLVGRLCRAIVLCEELITTTSNYEPLVVVKEKMRYNDTRPYKHGKAY